MMVQCLQENVDNEREPEATSRRKRTIVIASTTNGHVLARTFMLRHVGG